MLPIVGEKYWWKYSAFNGKLVEVVLVYPKPTTPTSNTYMVNVKVIDSKYCGEHGLIFSTLSCCLYDTITRMVEVL